jgi:hypothetical protein
MGSGAIVADPLASLPEGFQIEQAPPDPMASLPPGFQVEGPNIAAIQAALPQKQQDQLALAQARTERAKSGDANVAGLSQGALDVYRSVFDQPAAFLSKHLGDLGLPSGQTTNAQDTALSQKLTGQMGGGTMPGAMRALGNLAASAPLMPNPNLGPGRIASAIGGMFQGAEAGALTNAGSDASIGSQVGTGAVLGGTVPLVGRGLFDAGAWLKSKMLPSGNIDPQIGALAQRATDLGVPIRPGQMSPSGFIKTADDQLSRMPMTGYGADSTLKIAPGAQHEAFTRAVSKTFGEDAPALTQDVMANAQSRIGKTMNDAIGRNSVGVDGPLVQKLIDIKNGASDALDENAKPILSAVDKIVERMRASDDVSLTGEQYLNWRQRGGLLSALTEDQNPTVAYYGRELRRTLDDAFQRQAQGNDGELLSQARSQYRNLKTVEPLAAKAPTGKISPALLLGAVRSEFPNFATHGAGDLGDLARIGQAFIKEPPNSGTAERGLVLNMLTNPISAAGKVLGVPLEASIGRAMSSAINSPSYMQRLKGIPVRGVPLGGANGLGVPISNLLSIPLLNRVLASSSDPSR